MAAVPKWMPVFTVARARDTVEGAHPDAKRKAKASEVREHWTRIGTAFENPLGGFTVHLTAFPLNGTLVIRPPEAGEHLDPTTKRMRPCRNTGVTTGETW